MYCMHTNLSVIASCYSVLNGFVYFTDSCIFVYVILYTKMRLKGECNTSCEYVLEQSAQQAIYFDARFFKIGPEIRKLKWFGYIHNGCHGCRHI